MEHILGYDTWKTSSDEPTAYCDNCGCPICGDGITNVNGEHWCTDCLRDEYSAEVMSDRRRERYLHYMEEEYGFSDNTENWGD